MALPWTAVKYEQSSNMRVLKVSRAVPAAGSAGPKWLSCFPGMKGSYSICAPAAGKGLPCQVLAVREELPGRALRVTFLSFSHFMAGG